MVFDVSLINKVTVSKQSTLFFIIKSNISNTYAWHRTCNRIDSEGLPDMIMQIQENVIFVEFKKYSFTIEQAAEWMGEEDFNAAMIMPMENLKRIANHPEAMLTDAFEAYTAVIVARTTDFKDMPLAQVIEFPKRSESNAA
jgi:hypothetical protein